MKIDKKKFRGLMDAAGMCGCNAAGIASLMGYKDVSGLTYYLKAIRVGQNIKPVIVGKFIAVFSAIFERPVALKELIRDMDIPRAPLAKSQIKTGRKS